MKVFDYMEKDRSWRPTSNIYMYNTFKNHTKIKKGQNLGETYEIILEPNLDLTYSKSVGFTTRPPFASIAYPVAK